MLISAMFSKYCKMKYAPLGFIQSSGVFARIKNDVLQTFFLKKFEGVNIVTVVFAIVPLCMQLPRLPNNIPFPVLKIEEYELDNFFINRCAEKGGWIFDPCSSESITDCTVELINAIDDCLIPLFQKCTDCSSSLIELIKLEELFEQNRLKSLSILGVSDCAKPFADIMLFDSKKYFMALKGRHYEYAWRYLKHQVNYHSNEIKRMHEGDNPMQSGVVIQGHNEQYGLVKLHLEQLQAGNVAFFEKLVKANEAAMYKLLSTKYPKLLR